MGYRREIERAGFIAVDFADGNSRKLLPRNEFDGMTTALRSGLPFYEATDLFGNSYFIRLAMVSDITDYTAASLVEIDRYVDEENAAKTLTGSDT